jgi:phosphoribosylglycinamide formyltransferase 1
MTSAPQADRLPPLPIAVLISGGGTTLKNLIDRKTKDSLPIDIRLVISSKSNAGGLQYAAEASIPSQVIRRRDFESAEAYRDAMFDPIRKSNAAYVVMGGFLQHLLIPNDFTNRVINIHPSLIPSFCGQGMYGLNVHQAAVDYGAKLSGCTVHFVDDHYDHGPVILQKACPVLDEDTAESLQQRVFELEREALPEVLQLIQQNRVSITKDGRRVSIR